MRIPFLLTLLVLASVVDVREHRVPNAIPVALLLAGLVLAIATDGGAGAAWSLGGALLAGGLLLPFYALGGMGAGDVKLMGGAGALLGPATGLLAAGASLLVGGAIAVAYVVVRALAGRGSTPLAVALSPAVARARFGADRFPYAVAILGGTALAVFVAMPAAGAN